MSRPRGAAAALLACGALAAACGKKGPPLPPLVKVPAAPASFMAERRGAAVDLQFVVPAANTDNTRPANIQRVEVYAITSAETLTDDELVKRGTKVASVTVKAPKDPSQTIEEDEPADDMVEPEGAGLDQGALARVAETLTADMSVPAPPAHERRRKPAENEERIDGPLLGPTGAPLSRVYLAVGVSTRAKRGAPSKRLAVPLVPPPPQPAPPVIRYTEKSIAVTWTPVTPVGRVQEAAADDWLPSRPLVYGRPAILYNVYDPKAPQPKLTPKPLADAKFDDSRIVWGEERCYTIRAVETFGELTIESAAPEPVCETLKDTFAPAAPANLQSSPAEGAINLIWDANAERDLAGYLVFRGRSPETLEAITPAPIQETTFRDAVQPGVRFTYAVRAVDKAGNVSPLSKTVEEAGRD